jgi:hypothetical protein
VGIRSIPVKFWHPLNAKELNSFFTSLFSDVLRSFKSGKTLRFGESEPQGSLNTIKTKVSKVKRSTSLNTIKTKVSEVKRSTSLNTIKTKVSEVNVMRTPLAWRSGKLRGACA